MIKKILVTALVCLIVNAGVVLASVDNLKFDGYVADNAGVLSGEAVKNLNLTINDLNKKTTSAIAIVTVRTLGDKDMEKITDKIYKEYRIGDDEKQNGVVFFISIDDQQLQLLLGDGLNKKIKLKKLKNIIDENVIPYFASGEYDKGIVRGTYLVADTMAKIDKQKVEHFGVMPDKKKSAKEDFNKNWLWLLLLPALGVLGGIIWSFKSLKSKKD